MLGMWSMCCCPHTDKEYQKFEEHYFTILMRVSSSVTFTDKIPFHPYFTVKDILGFAIAIVS